MKKPRALGPVHLYPERPKALKVHDNVADVEEPSLFGKVTSVVPHRVGEPERYVVAWELGGSTVARRDELLSRFSTETRKRK